MEVDLKNFLNEWMIKTGEQQRENVFFASKERYILRK